MKRNIIVAWMVACLLLFAAACGSGNAEPEEQTDAADIAEYEDYWAGDDDEQGAEDAYVELDYEPEPTPEPAVGEYTAPDESCFTWVDVDGGVAITGYTGDYDAVIIPDTLGGSSVVEIRNGISDSVDLTGVKIPDSVTVVGDKAFYLSTALMEVEFGDNVETVGDYAFGSCYRLKDVGLNEGLKILGDGAFMSCESLEEIVLPSTLTIIGSECFSYSALKSVTIPGSVQTIGSQAFTYCDSLRTVAVEEGVEDIRSWTFSDNGSLRTVTLPASLESISDDVFDDSPQVVVDAPLDSYAYEFALENNLLADDTAAGNDETGQDEIGTSASAEETEAASVNSVDMEG